MMKVFLILNLIVSFMVVDAHAVSERQMQKTDTTRAGGDDNPVPWPWGLELDFPWTSIEGTWKIKTGELDTYFVFKVLKSRAPLKQLKITQIDPMSCEVIGTGAGVETGRLVRGQISDYTGKVYNVSLHVFSKSAVPATLIGATRANKLLVMEIFSSEGRGGFYHFLLERVNARTNMVCP